MKTTANKKPQKIKAFSFCLVILSFLLSGSLVYANSPQIISANIIPSNPGWEQQFILNINMCIDEYSIPNELLVAASTSSAFQPPNTGGQVFLISSDGINIPDANPNNANSGMNFGYNLPMPSPFVQNCNDCGGAGSGMLVTETYTLTMPGAQQMGTACGATNLNLLIGADSSYFGGSNWVALTNGACSPNGSGLVLGWPLPTPPANSITLDKRAEGVLQNVGDLVLFSIDYTYGNGPLTITDALPGGGSLALVSVGPSSINSGSVSAPVAGATTGTVTWTFPTSTYMKSGTVWILMMMTTAMASGTSIPNTATGTSGSTNASASATLIVGQAAISVQKLESVSTFMKLPSSSVMITYYLNYQVNGDQLKVYRAFDDTATGTSSTTPPSGWKLMPYNTDNGTWTISDPCNSGDRILTGAGQSSSYPALLLDDPTPSNVQICTGIVEADVFINPGTYPGADGLVILRDNGQTGANNYGYSLILSMDTAPSDGYLAIQRCGGGMACIYGGASSSQTITGNTWYRTKTYMTTNGTDYIFNAKVWQIGQPEPAGYQVSWTDTGAASNANFNCSGTGTYTDWRPGVGNQSGDGNGTVQDSYNNFMILVPRVAANAVLYDTVPTGLTYQGSSPGASGTSPVSWQLGNISDQSGSYTWWASTSACAESFTNVGGIGATNIVPEFSNQTVFNIICISPTVTPTTTPAFTISKTSSKTIINTTNDIVTFNLVFCNNSGGATQNFTIIDDWSSDNADGWQFNWNNNTNINANGISTINVNTNNGISTVSIVPTPGGFMGCYTWQMWLTNNQHINTCNWNNNASLIYPGQAASPVSTVIMQDACSTPTVTFTQVPPGSTLTNTPTVTPTYTITPTVPCGCTASTTPTETPTMTTTQSMPPIFTINKTVVGSADMTDINAANIITFALHICNTGGYTVNQVLLTDSWNSTADDQFSGPYGVSNGSMGPNESNGSFNFSLTWPSGFAANSCQDFTYTVENYYLSSQYWCMTWPNTASISYAGVTVNSNTINVNHICPSSTSTFTVTPTYTYTATMTLTPSLTVTITPTASQTQQIAGATSTPTLNIQQVTPTATPAPPHKKPRPYPNPVNPGKWPGLTILYYFTQGTDRVTVKIYTVSFRLVKQFVFDGAQMQQIITQGYLNFEPGELNDLSDGTYYYVILTDNNGKTEISEPDTIIILR